MKLNLWVLAALAGGGYFYWQSQKRKTILAAQNKAREMNPDALVVPLSPERAAEPLYNPNASAPWDAKLQGFALGAFGEQVVQAPRW